jgi:serine/threonine protein kinase
MEKIHEKVRLLKGLQDNEEIELNSSGYNLQSDIGSGTFGQVKLATHIDTGLPVAIKILNKAEIQQNDDFERVAREFDILVKINHPNIIYLYEVTYLYVDH